ncbi:MAG: caspase family protein [Bacteroidaceae bacterium]|nr:caspase family protein [Bacteroidaceae bacterium]
MVGVSNYDTALTSYQWNNINGVADIQLLKPILEKQGFQISAIIDDAATYLQITKQLEQFIRGSKKGDIVYLHFSTHGQPVEDFDGDEEDGWDEAVIPIDAYKLYRRGVYQGERHLLDDQLNKYLQQLRSKIGKNGMVYVVIDACHAGTASRGNDDVVRGTHVGFSPNGKVFKPIKDKRSHFKVEHNAKWSDVVFLEACRADQLNTEIRVESIRYGALSYHLAKTMQEEPLSTQPQSFIERLKQMIRQQGRWPNNQNIVIETSLQQ